MITYESAKKELESGIVNAQTKKYFVEHDYSLEHGYCLILEGKLSEAIDVLKKMDSLRADWAIKFIPFMQGYVEVLPTYFQIRNFLEIDLNLLIMAKQVDLISYVLGGADLLYSVNCESYKYIARVFMNNGYLDIAKNYIDLGRNNTYNDPELHFMNAQYYNFMHDKGNALQAIEDCLKILPEYYPAIKIKESLLEN